MASRDLVVHIIGDDRSLQRAYKQSAVATDRFDRKMSQTFRGAAAGSGVFKSLGRSLAFASGGFIAAASVTDVLRGSITQATEAAKVQGQLAAQFKASGQNLSLYQDQIDETSNKLSVLAGIENDELKAAFVTAFRGTEDVSSALKIQAIAADVARARGISLATATLALTKAYGGQSTALRRLGVLIPPTLHGIGALNFVQEKFAGQAAAGTTAQERFTAAIKNMEEAIGTALLPTFNELLGAATEWLSNSENQKKVQEDVESVVRTSATAFGLLADAIGKTSAAYKFLTGLPMGKKGLLDLPGGRTGLLDLPGGRQGLIGIISDALGGGGGGGGITGFANTADRVPGRAPGGAGTFQAIQATIATIKHHASLAFQMSMLQEQLAKAELTAGQRDDRAVLTRTANLIRRRIAVTKDLHDRTALYQSLGGVEQQILQIDAKAASDRQDALDKEKSAKQKQLDAEKARLEAHREHIRKMRAAWQEQLQALRAAAEQVRNEFGALPFQATPGGILGVQGQSTKSLVGAYINQTRQYTGFYNALGRLGKMGAPKGLIEQIRGQGAETGGIIARGLITHPGQLRRLVRAFGERERVVQQIAHADIHARIVHLHVAGARPGATTAASRRGRNAGIPLTGT